jgi:hypothetical protein
MDWIKRHLVLTGAIIALVALILGVTLSSWVGDVYDDHVRLSLDAFTPTTQPSDDQPEPTAAPVVVSGPVNINITIGGTPVAAPVVGGSAAASDHHVSDNFFRFLFWLILFGAGAGLVALLFDFLNKSRSEYHSTVLALAKHDIFTKPVIVSSQPIAVEPEGALRSFAAGEEVPSGPKFRVEISGPDHAVVGVHTRYTAKIVGDAPPNAMLTWQAAREGQPEAPAVIEPSTGTVVFVRPTSPGDFQLKVLVNDVDGFLEKPFTVTAMPAETSSARSIELPFVGQGYGTLMLAIVIILALIVLGMEDVISGEAIAPILGAIAGYIFGVTKPADSK